MGFDIRVEYRAGSLNKVADALSWREDETGLLCPISQPILSLFALVKAEIEETWELWDLRDQILQGIVTAPWAVHDGLILFHQRVFLLPTSPLISSMITSIPNATHEGIQKDFTTNSKGFLLEEMKTMIQNFANTYLVC